MKQRVSLRLLLVGALLLVCTAALAQSPGSLVGRVAERTLDNGLTVLVLPREGAPVVALQMTYRVGGVDEPVGKSGMAHVLEHMLFKGTRTLGTRDWEAEKPLLEEIERVGRALDRERRSGGDEAAVAALSEELAALQAKHRPLSPGDRPR